MCDLVPSGLDTRVFRRYVGDLRESMRNNITESVRKKDLPINIINIIFFAIFLKSLFGSRLRKMILVSVLSRVKKKTKETSCDTS